MKLHSFGSERVGLIITGKPKNREPEFVTVDFPGGQVEISRAFNGEDADYWVHVKINHPQNAMRYPEDDEDDGQITDARIDLHGVGPVKETRLFDPRFYHLAVRVTRPKNNNQPKER